MSVIHFQNSSLVQRQRPHRAHPQHRLLTSGLLFNIEFTVHIVGIPCHIMGDESHGFDFSDWSSGLIMSLHDHDNEHVYGHRGTGKLTATLTL
jgi:hypothetical protein